MPRCYWIACTLSPWTKNRSVNSRERHHYPRRCQMRSDLYSNTMWILRIIVAAILQRLLVCRQPNSLCVLAGLVLSSDVEWTSTRKPCGLPTTELSVGSCEPLFPLPELSAKEKSRKNSNLWFQSTWSMTTRSSKQK